MKTMDMYSMTDGVSGLMLRHWAHLDPLSSQISNIHVYVRGRSFNPISLWKMSQKPQSLGKLNDT